MDFQPVSFQEKIFIGQQKSLLEIQAEIYSILQTSGFLQTRYNSGRLGAEFYFRRMKSFQDEIVQMQSILSNKGKNLVDLTQNMPLSQDSAFLIRELSSISDASYDKFCQTWSIDPFQLANVVAMITSKFITVLDYIQLTDVLDPHFLMELIQDVSQALLQMHSFQHFAVQLSQIFQSWQFDQQHINSTVKTNHSPPTHSELKKVLGDRIYSLFNAFKGYLQK
jgi:hypothetical protein